MSLVQYQPNSVYADTPQTYWYLGYLQFRNVVSSIDDEEFVLDQKYKYRPDLLSNDKFGTPNYWWVFMVRNPDKIVDPIYDFLPGLVIYIPQQSNIQ